MVIDSSAILAALFDEADRDFFLEALSQPSRKFMSAINYLETSIVVEARKGPRGSQLLNEFLATIAIETLPFDASQSLVAFDAWRTYGKGRHPAGLNLGDFAAYALAKTLNQELLFKGDDFSRTDVAPYPGLRH